MFLLNFFMLCGMKKDFSYVRIFWKVFLPFLWWLKREIREEHLLWSGSVLACFRITNLQAVCKCSRWSGFSSRPVLSKISCTCLMLLPSMTSSNLIFVWLALLLITWLCEKNSSSNIWMGLGVFLMCWFSKMNDFQKLLLILKCIEDRISNVSAIPFRILQSVRVFGLAFKMLPPLRQKIVLFQLLSYARLCFIQPHLWEFKNFWISVNPRPPFSIFA